jgi:hypothetical protein
VTGLRARATGRHARWTVGIAMTIALVAGTSAVMAQRGGRIDGLGDFFNPFRGRGGGEPIAPNTPYDGRFTFVRLRYGPPSDFAAQGMQWTHDYPLGEQHFMKIINELTNLNPHTTETNVLDIADPELFKYPVAYLCEPGRLFDITDEGVANLRDYLTKGGFLIVDDFRYEDWPYFEQQMLRVLPAAQFRDLDVSHPIFNAFFAIKALEVPQYYDQGPAMFRAVFEDNDPTKRIMVMINYNTDISEYWEFSDTGFKPIDESNEAYKIGVNYVIYGMTH